MRQETYKWLGGRPLQSFYSVTIETHDLPEDQQYYAPGTTQWVTTHKEVVFNSRIHVNKEKRFTFSFSGQFTDQDILRDSHLLTKIYEAYGADIFA